MSYYAETSGRHTMAVMLKKKVDKALSMLDIPTESEAAKEQRRCKAEGRPYGLVLFGTRYAMTREGSDIMVNGLDVPTWAKTGISEQQAKSMMQDSPVLQSCSWEELWKAYKNN